MAQQLHHILQPFIMKLQRFFVILLVSEASLLDIVYLLYKWRVNTTYCMAHREMTFLLNNIHSRIKRDILNFFHTHKKKLQVVIPNNLDLILLGTPAQFSAQCVKVGTFSRASTQHQLWLKWEGGGRAYVYQQGSIAFWRYIMLSRKNDQGCIDRGSYCRKKF